MRFLSSLLLLFLLGGCRGFPSAKDADESSKIWIEVVSKYPFRVPAKLGNRPAVYQLPGKNYSEIRVYGDYSKQEQDEIYKVVASVSKDIATKPVHLYFYPVELREENLLRKEVIQ
jgi:hypothetical protein